MSKEYSLICVKFFFYSQEITRKKNIFLLYQTLSIKNSAERRNKKSENSAMNLADSYNLIRWRRHVRQIFSFFLHELYSFIVWRKWTLFSLSLFLFSSNDCENILLAAINSLSFILIFCCSLIELDWYLHRTFQGYAIALTLNKQGVGSSNFIQTNVVYCFVFEQERKKCHNKRRVLYLQNSLII